MQIRYLLTAMLLVSGLHAGQHDLASDIPEEEREAYRKCVIADVTKPYASESATTHRDTTGAIIKQHETEAKLDAYTLLHWYTIDDLKQAEQSSGYCSNLLKPYEPLNLFTSTYKHPYYQAIKHSTHKRAQALQTRLMHYRSLLAKTPEEVQYNLENVTSEEMDNLPSTLKQNIHDIQELATKRIDADEAEETENADT